MNRKRTQLCLMRDYRSINFTQLSITVIANHQFTIITNQIIDRYPGAGLSPEASTQTRDAKISPFGL